MWYVYADSARIQALALCRNAWLTVGSPAEAVSSILLLKDALVTSLDGLIPMLDSLVTTYTHWHGLLKTL